MAKAKQTKEVQETVTEEVATEATPTQNQALTINDIRNMVNIIDISSDRGAWKGQELSTVGAIRDRLASIVNAAAAAAEAENEEASEEASE